MRYSRQREAVHEALIKTDCHPTAEWIFNEVKKVIPSVSLGTVYRNLNELKSQNEIITLETADESLHYDGNTEFHRHFICTRCGLISDIFDLVSDEEKYLKEKGYILQKQKTIYYGVCRKCNNKLL